MNELNIGSRQTGVTTPEMFTYVLIVIVISAMVFGKYMESSHNNSISEAVALGETQKVMIEEYFKAHEKMPQSGADAGLEEFTPAGVLKELTWQPGVPGEADSDKLLTGTLNGRVTLSDFGERFEDLDSAYLLVARAQEDGTIAWECKNDTVSRNAVPGRYLPETCKSDSDDEA